MKTNSEKLFEKNRLRRSQMFIVHGHVLVSKHRRGGACIFRSSGAWKAIRTLKL